MKKERIIVPVGHIEQNKGQLAPWLPKNPRLWTKSDLERMKASIVEDPDLLQDEDAIAVVAHPSKKGHYIVFDGNLRSTAAQELYDKGHELNAWLYTPEGEEDQETIRRRTIKANGFYGSNDWEALANEWPEDKLEAWGIPVWQAPKAPGEGDDDARPSTSSIGSGDVKVDGAFAYAIRINCKSLQEQLDLSKELQQRGYDVATL